MYVISWASQLSEIDTILFSFTDENLERFGNLFMVTQSQDLNLYILPLVYVFLMNMLHYYRRPKSGDRKNGLTKFL